MEMVPLFHMFTCFFLLLIWSLFISLYYVLWLKPERRRIKLQRQGIRGPSPSLVLGNIPEMSQIQSVVQNPEIPSKDAKEPSVLDFSSTLFPYFKQWTNQYGRMFMFALGRTQIMYVSDPVMVREINRFRSLELGKPAYLQKDRGPLLGRGLITTNGALWYHQRKIISPELYMDKVKDKLNLIVESGSRLVKSWERIIEIEGGISDIRVDDHVRSFTSYIISKMLFGNDHHRGMEIFPKFHALIAEMASPTLLSGVPFLRYIPTQKNRKVWRLEKEIRSMIMDLAKERAEHTPEDMLQVILEGASNGDELGSSSADEFVVDNCKDIYLAAAEVTAIAAIWGLMLLAVHPEWQARVRTEVLEVCGGCLPDTNMLSKMKVLRMVIQEMLRLYPGVAFVSRQALKDVKLGDICVTKDVNIWIWMLALHRDPKLWGPDADKFNPERFASGVSGACKTPQAYIPFGVGARVCPGQSLAMAEMKVLFAMILSRFSFTISPNYRHSPKFGLLLEPEHGVNLLVQKI